MVDGVIKKLRQIRMELILISLSLCALGIFLFIFPEISQEIISKGIGVALCVWGVLRLISYFKVIGNEVLGSFGLVQGVSLISFGFFIVIKPEVISNILGTALAIIVIVDGILKLQYAVDFLHLNYSRWWIELIGAVILVALGIISLVNPFSGVTVLIRFLGAIIFIAGIIDLVSLIKIIRAASRMETAIINAAASANAVDMKED